MDYVSSIYVCHWKGISCLFYCVQIHIYQICKFCTEIKGYHITWPVLRTWIVFLLIICGNFTLTLKTGGCWNLFESSTASIPLIEWNQKWTWIIFIISNYKLRIWIFSQPSIYLNSQSYFYNVLTLEHKIFFPGLHILWSPENIQTTYLEQIIYLVPSSYMELYL